jgi:hypothetical protein
MVVELLVRPRLELGLCQSEACNHAANAANPRYRKELTMPELKTRASDASVDKFLQGIKDEKKRQDCYQILKIMKKATKAEPKMWGTAIIGFGDYHYKYESGRENDWFLAGFSPRVQNLALYMMGGFDKEVLKKLGNYKTGKGCLYINKLEDVDLRVLNELITQSVKQSKANLK